MFFNLYEDKIIKDQGYCNWDYEIKMSFKLIIKW